MSRPTTNILLRIPQKTVKNPAKKFPHHPNLDPRYAILLHEKPKKPNPRSILHIPRYKLPTKKFQNR